MNIQLLNQVHSTHVSSSILKSHLIKSSALMSLFQSVEGGCPPAWGLQEFQKLGKLSAFLLKDGGKVNRNELISQMQWILAPSSKESDAPTKDHNPLLTQTQVDEEREQFYQTCQSTMAAAEQYIKACHTPSHLPPHPRGHLQEYLSRHVSDRFIPLPISNMN